MKTANLDKVLHVRIARTLDRAIRAEARRLHVKPSEVARVALARGLRGLADPVEDRPQTQEAYQ